MTIHCHPGRGDDLIPALAENALHSRAEPGCRRWEWYRHEDDPDRFALFELYDDGNAFEEHKQTAHFADWRVATSDLIARKESARYLAPR